MAGRKSHVFCVDHVAMVIGIVSSFSDEMLFKYSVRSYFHSAVIAF